MALAFKQNGSYDITIDPNTGSFAMVDGRKAYANIIEDCIRTQQGELQLDTDRGIPYLTSIFDSPEKIPVWRSFVNDIVMSFDFVKSIVSFDYEFDAVHHILKYEIIIETDDGLITVTQ